MPTRLPDHPLRLELTREVHARPFAHLVAPQRITHLAMLSGETAAEADRAHVATLCRRCGVPPPADDDNHLMADLGAVRLKWERHTEFSTYTFFAAAEPAGVPFAAPAIALLPDDWLAGLPGDLLVGIHVELEAATAAERGPEQLSALFASDSFTGSQVSGGAACAWADFNVNDDGFGHMLIRDRTMAPRQAGRLVQRLLEIESYRMMALLAFPVARRSGQTVSGLAARLTVISREMAAIKALEDERSLLGELTELSAEVEQLAVVTGYRFDAARAYHALVERRILELRELRLPGFQTVAEFMERRLAPAMRTCVAVTERLDRLSRRVNRASQLLRTRVDIQLEAQNRDLLRSMDRRARLQLRLQETVEGLSVAAISYYLVGLVAYGAKALKAGGLALDSDLVAGLAIPLVVALVWFGVRRVRRMVERDAGAGEP